MGGEDGSPLRARRVRFDVDQAGAVPGIALPAHKRGADLRKLAYCAAVGASVWLLPPPHGVAPAAWRLFAVFLSTITGIILTPLPLGAVCLLGLCSAMLTGAIPPSAAFSAFASDLPWLVAAAFWLSGGFMRSGLGARIAYTIVSLFGSTTLGLTYSLVGAEALLAPAIPSVAARAGGLMLPITKALCVACGSDSAAGTERRMGSFTLMACFLCTTVTSGMFITACTANPLAISLAAQALDGAAISWGRWALAGAVPGAVCLLSIPALLYLLDPPELRDTPDAPAKAREELAKLGPFSGDEQLTAAALGVTLALWVLGGPLGVSAVAATLTGLAILLVSGVVTWKQCLADHQALDTVIWFGVLMTMSSQLNTLGLIPWLSSQVVKHVGGLGLGWRSSFVIILAAYFYSHHVFASSSAHVGAMYQAFLAAAVACGTPGLVAALALGQLSSPMGCLTTNGTGSAPAYYAAGYVTHAQWYRHGAACAAFCLAVWLLAGATWWRVCGIW